MTTMALHNLCHALNAAANTGTVASITYCNLLRMNTNASFSFDILVQTAYIFLILEYEFLLLQNLDIIS